MNLSMYVIAIVDTPFELISYVRLTFTLSPSLIKATWSIKFMNNIPYVLYVWHCTLGTAPQRCNAAYQLEMSEIQGIIDEM